LAVPGGAGRGEWRPQARLVRAIIKRN